MITRNKTSNNARIRTMECYVHLKRWSKAELDMEIKKIKEKGSLSSKKKSKKPSHQSALAIEGNPRVSRVTRQSRQNHDEKTRFETSTQPRIGRVKIVSTMDKVITRGGRSTIQKKHMIYHFIKESRKSNEKETIQPKHEPLKSCVRFGHDIYVKEFKNYLYWLKEQDRENQTVKLRDGIKTQLRLDSEDYKLYVNKKLVKEIIKLSLKIDVSSDQWGQIENAIKEAENQVLMEREKSKGRLNKSKKRMEFSYFNQLKELEKDVSLGDQCQKSNDNSKQPKKRKAEENDISSFTELKKLKVSGTNNFAKESGKNDEQENEINSSVTETPLSSSDMATVKHREDISENTSTHLNISTVYEATNGDKLSEMNNCKQKIEIISTIAKTPSISGMTTVNSREEISDNTLNENTSTHLIVSTVCETTDFEKLSELNHCKQENEIILTETKIPSPFISDMATVDNCEEIGDNTLNENVSTVFEPTDDDRLSELNNHNQENGIILIETKAISPLISDMPTVDNCGEISDRTLNENISTDYNVSTVFDATDFDKLSELNHCKQEKEKILTETKTPSFIFDMATVDNCEEISDNTLNENTSAHVSTVFEVTHGDKLPELNNCKQENEIISTITKTSISDMATVNNCGEISENTLKENTSTHFNVSTDCEVTDFDKLSELNHCKQENEILTETKIPSPFNSDMATVDNYEEISDHTLNKDTSADLEVSTVFETTNGDKLPELNNCKQRNEIISTVTKTSPSISDIAVVNNCGKISENTLKENTSAHLDVSTICEATDDDRFSELNNRNQESEIISTITNAPSVSDMATVDNSEEISDNALNENISTHSNVSTICEDTDDDRLSELNNHNHESEIISTITNTPSVSGMATVDDSEEISDNALNENISTHLNVSTICEDTDDDRLSELNNRNQENEIILTITKTHLSFSDMATVNNCENTLNENASTHLNGSSVCEVTDGDKLSELNNDIQEKEIEPSVTRTPFPSSSGIATVNNCENTIIGNISTHLNFSTVCEAIHTDKLSELNNGKQEMEIDRSINGTASISDMATVNNYGEVNKNSLIEKRFIFMNGSCEPKCAKASLFADASILNCDEKRSHAYEAISDDEGKEELANEKNSKVFCSFPYLFHSIFRSFHYTIPLCFESFSPYSNCLNIYKMRNSIETKNGFKSQFMNHSEKRKTTEQEKDKTKQQEKEKTKQNEGKKKTRKSVLRWRGFQT